MKRSMTPPGPRSRLVTLVLAGLTLLAFVLAAPEALREAFARGNIYIFTWRFLADIPARLSGPGRFRFILQPLVATILGIRDGLADARAARPPYLFGVLFRPAERTGLVVSGARSLANLLLMGILLDTVFQWVILGAAYPGAALVVGPVLITGPYAAVRALVNRLVTAFRRP
jgi:hypothetical protein